MLRGTKEPKLEQGWIGVGRRPPGFAEANPRLTSRWARKTASYLARMGHLAAASIVAFDQLVCELRYHGAPSDFITRSLDAKTAEVRHARDMARLAIQAGAAVEGLSVAARTTRSLVELAIDNVTEGCVRQSYGALIAHRQASHAASAEVRLVMQSIAMEETEHAALSWDLHNWIQGRLTFDERARVETAFERAVAMLEVDCLFTEPDDVRTELGLPDAAESRALATNLFGHMARAA